MNLRSPVTYLEHLPDKKTLAEALNSSPENILIIYDRALLDHKFFAKWLKTYDKSYGVRAGERVKNVDDFARRLGKIIELLGPLASRKGTCLVAVGGGSVGDFVGFVASVFKRGVPLIQIPSTFLAAVDSAHGGKTALNYRDIKNQIGTFYPAMAVMIVEELLQSLPKKFLRPAAGELVKMALINGGKFYENYALSTLEGFELFYKFVPDAIEAKYAVVDADPMEHLGPRQVLNFGHSLGHCLEAYYGIPHGEAVAYGIAFALNWSHHRGLLDHHQLEMAQGLLNLRISILRPQEFLKKRNTMSRRRLRKLISHDKKLTQNGHMTFVFLEKIGKPLTKNVTIDSFLTEAQRQGWLKA